MTPPQTTDAPTASTVATTAPPSPDAGNVPPTVPAWIGGTLSATALLDSGVGIVDCTDANYSYYEMVEDLAQLENYYPTHFSYRTIGRSVLGREIYVGVLGNPAAKRQIVVSAAIHAREHMTAMLTMKQLEFYLAYYEVGDYAGQSFADLFEDCCFYVVPMTNPDGVMLSQEGISSVNNAAVRSRLESIYYSDKKSGRTDEPTLESYLRVWKANARGVDLNRNYDAGWSSYVGVSAPSASHYKGSSPASEPETEAMVGLIHSLSGIDAVLCIHSQGQVLYWNCGQEEPLQGETHAFANAVSTVNGYKVITAQNNDASLSDWAALKKGVPSITVETGYGACPLPHEQFLSIWRENFALYAMSAAYFALR
jgi:g-D-glutamyl-meso-diaminopimelate peptidase